MMNRFTKYKIFCYIDKHYRRAYIVEKYFLSLNIKTVGIVYTRHDAVWLAKEDNKHRKTRFYGDAKGGRKI